MKHATRITLSLSLLSLLTLAASCSKPVAPETALAPDPDAFTTAEADTGSLLRLIFETHLAEDAKGLRNGRHRTTLLFTVPAAPTTFPRRDTIPAHSTLLRVEWWRRDTTGWSVIRTPVSSVRLDTAAPGQTPADMPAGVQGLVVPRPAEWGGGRVRFHVHVGLAPVEWWAGPDPSRWPLLPDGDGRAVDIRDWSTFANSAGRWPLDGRGWFGPDSFAYRPSDRRPLGRGGERRTFWEIRGNRIYAHDEGDTVRLGSWLVFAHGGFDNDSPYVPHVVSGDPALPAGWESDSRAYALLQSAGLVGSPIAMRLSVRFRQGDGRVGMHSETTNYPFFDIASVFRQPQVFGYSRPVYPGKYYVIARAEDGDHQLGLPAEAYTNSVQDAVDRVDAGGGSASELALRRRVLTFHVANPER